MRTAWKVRSPSIVTFSDDSVHIVEDVGDNDAASVRAHPLSWNPSTQLFERSFQDVEEPYVAVQRLLTSPRCKQVIRTKGIYGVLSVVQTSVLLYIREIRWAGDFPPFGAIHQVVLLGRVPLWHNFEDFSTLSAASTAPDPQALSEEYLQLVDQFCDGLSYDGGKGLYFSFSGNLACRAALLWNAPQSTEELRNAVGEPWDTNFSVTLCTFQWNKALCGAFDKACAQPYVVSCIRGCVTVSDQIQGTGLALISRVSVQNAGTRYHRRGVNAEGAAAIFVESEQTAWTSRAVACAVMLRGSVPVKWSQTADFSIKPPVTIGSDEVRMFERHVAKLGKLYPTAASFWCVNLLSHAAAERTLSAAYCRAVGGITDGRVFYRDMPLEATRTSGASVESALSGLWDEMPLSEMVTLFRMRECGQKNLEENGADAETLGKVSQECRTSQKAYARLNCLDCVDRSSIATWLLGRKLIPHQLKAVESEADARTLESVLRQQWISHSNELSRLYAGTDSHASAVLARVGVAAAMCRSARIAVSRWVQQHFRDGAKQDIVSLLTGWHVPPPRLDATYSSPFRRRLTHLNGLVRIGVGTALTLWAESLVVFGAHSDWRSAVLLGLWSVVLAFFLWAVKMEATTLTNFPVLPAALPVKKKALPL